MPFSALELLSFLDPLFDHLFFDPAREQFLELPLSIKKLLLLAGRFRSVLGSPTLLCDLEFRKFRPLFDHSFVKILLDLGKDLIDLRFAFLLFISEFLDLLKFRVKHGGLVNFALNDMRDRFFIQHRVIRFLSFVDLKSVIPNSLDLIHQSSSALYDSPVILAVTLNCIGDERLFLWP